MFDKFKQAKQIKDLKNQLAKEKETCEKGGVSVTVNGQMRISSIEIDQELSGEDAQELVKDCINEGLQNIQKKAAQKMKDSGAF